MLRTTTFALLALAAVPSAVFGIPTNSTKILSDRCPPEDDCYIDLVPSNCSPTESCTIKLVPSVACKWNCGDNNLPFGCQSRCKPCHSQVCPAICECEIQCNLFGPCSAHIIDPVAQAKNATISSK
ncbi:hypothetical protein EV183_002789 [Coemansia sp. RSA 2336]|nr:hypothetical protein EV183_002789 [Coemansia sp. RSA 2336]